MSRIDEIENRLSVWLLGRPRWVFKDFAYLLRIARAAAVLPEPTYIDHSSDEVVCIACGERAFSAWHGATVTHADTCPLLQLRAALEGE